MKWKFVDGEVADEPTHPSEYACVCEEKVEFDLTISEGSVVLTCPTCEKPLDLDAIGWWSEALHMDDPVRVRTEFIIEPGGYYDPPEPSYVHLTLPAEQPLQEDDR